MAAKTVWHRTAKHDVIKSWALARAAVPAKVRGTQDALKLKIGKDETAWEPIEWSEWLEIFESNQFAFLFEEPGFSNKIVKRNGAEDGAKPSD
jgi:hypothetical protein